MTSNSPLILPPPYNFFPNEENSLRVCSLWDMIDTPTWNLVNHASGLTDIRDRMKARYHAAINVGMGPLEYSDNDRNSIEVMDTVMRPWLQSHHLVASLDRLDRVVEYSRDPDCHIDDLADKITALLEALEDELKRKIFLYLPSEFADFYQHPEKVFPETLKSFPSAADDIREACRCYALEANSACVFHCMGIVQRGLYALAVELKVELKFPLHLAEWQTIIDSIEKKIEPMRDGPRGTAKDDQLSYYSECASQFRYFKDAWRNHIAHMRENYSQSQARTVLSHVQEFMECLFRRIKEIPVPPITA